MTDAPAANPVLAEVVRGGLVEGRHRGRWLLTGPDGAVLDSSGPAGLDGSATIGGDHFYPRSAAKPLQTWAMVENGLDLAGPLLALASASHSGEPFHLDGVEQILAGAGLGVAALANIPDLPLDDQARDAWLAAGRGREPIAMNCSGKHAAMVRTCVRRGWPVEGYLDPGHPLQRAILDRLAALTATVDPRVTVDGCGAPLVALSMAGLAHAFGRLAAATDGPGRRIADAFRSHPEYASGTRRDELALHRAVPGLVAKAGAEGVMAVGLADGRGFVVKIDDGAPRARQVVTAALLGDLVAGDLVAGVPGVDAAALSGLATLPVLGGGRPVGAVEARVGRR